MIKKNRISKNLISQSAEGPCLLPNFMYLILLETSGNQRYIFSTNKLRENVGASELTYQIGARFAKELAENKNGIKKIIATSGKALLLADDEKIAKDFVKEVTLHALKEMPGLTIHGAISKVEDESSADSLHQAVGDVHKRLEEIRYQIPGNLQRFQRIPFVAGCASSNLPASNLFKHEDLPESEPEKPHSIVSITKQIKSKEGKNRLENSVKKYEPNLHFADNISALDKKFDNTNWLAVIHADGNGLGQIFLDFQKHAKAKNANEYCEKYNNFSEGLDECTTKAAAFALKEMRDKIGDTSIEIPAIPLVLGGDDLTIICDGQYAIKFTKDFLNKFVEETKNPKIQSIFPDGINLGICAGIAIIKPHFPFHQAYDLAAELLQSAKKVKTISTSLSAFDYHVLYDSSGTKLDEIREKTPFVARPYVVTENAQELAKGPKHETWLKNHHFDELAKRVEVMIPDENGDRKLPNSQLHVLREGLYISKDSSGVRDEVDSRAKLIAHRYDSETNQPFEKLYADKSQKSLFFEEEGNFYTHLLDAMDVVDLWKGGETRNGK